MTTVAHRLQVVRERIAAACSRARRRVEDVRIVAVTKTQPCSVVREAILAGVDAIGENRVQEAAAKRPKVGEPISWHLVGPLQRNKARTALELFDLIETVDRTALADRLEVLAAAAGRMVPVFLEVNVGGEAQKSGVNAAETPRLAEAVLTTCPHLALRGLMTVPPYHPDPERSRPHFARLRAVAEELSERFSLPPLELSMGMSEDFPVAVEEGATWVRLGRILLGERPAEP